MATTRRPGEESRIRLIEAAAAIIREEGHAALSARRLAERVGLKRQIVHYYFGTIDDMLLAVVRHYGELGLARFDEAFAQGDPLRVMWEVEPDASATSFAFIAMAPYRPAVRRELLRYVELFRKLQVEAIQRYTKERQIDLGMPPIAALIIIQAVAQGLAAEASMGATPGHAETRAAMEQLIAALADGSYARAAHRPGTPAGQAGVPRA